MERNRKNSRSPRSTREVAAPKAFTGDEDFDDEELTDPRVDTEVQNAIASLRRVQVDTRKRASDIESLLTRRKTTPP